MGHCLLKKEDGGLGVRMLKEFNLALLGKWVWKILEEIESLWYMVLCACYGEEGAIVLHRWRQISLVANN